ncbi:MAG: LacI family DNA-binding transcriptional regulator, partial [Lachnospiraceae bacterium]
MGVTIKEIAQMAGVHRSTVDKVLHNRPGVSDSVRQRIQKIIDECHYEANPIGKALQMQDKTLHICAIMLEVDAYPFLKKGMEEGLKNYTSFQLKIDYKMIEYSNVEAQAIALEQCKEDKLDGIILSPINTPEIVEKIDQCTAAGIPVITVNTDIKGSQRLCYIGQDGFKAGCVAGRLMGEFLQGKGKVAVFTSDSDDHQSFPFGTREGGFRKVVTEKYPELEILPSIYTKEKSSIIRCEMHRLYERIPDLAGVFITCGGVKAVGDVIEECNMK